MRKVFSAIGFLLFMLLVFPSVAAHADSVSDLLTEIKLGMNDYELSSVAGRYGFHVEDVRDGMKKRKNEIILVDAGAKVPRVGGIVPEKVNSSYVYIVKNSAGSYDKVEFFSKDKLICGYYFGSGNEFNVKRGYYIYDPGYVNPDPDSTTGKLIPVDSFEEIAEYEPLERKPLEEPLGKLFTKCTAKLKEKQFLKLLDEYGLVISASGQVINNRGSYYIVAYPNDKYSEMTANFSPKGVMISASYSDFATDIVTDKTACFRAKDYAKFFNVDSDTIYGYYTFTFPDSGRTVFSSPYKKAEDAINDMFSR